MLTMTQAKKQKFRWISLVDADWKLAGWGMAVIGLVSFVF